MYNILLLEIMQLMLLLLISLSDNLLHNCRKAKMPNKNYFLKIINYGNSKISMYKWRYKNNK